jgi:hypothetical protein
MIASCTRSDVRDQASSPGRSVGHRQQIVRAAEEVLAQELDRAAQLAHALEAIERAHEEAPLALGRCVGERDVGDAPRGEPRAHVLALRRRHVERTAVAGVRLAVEIDVAACEVARLQGQQLARGGEEIRIGLVRRVVEDLARHFAFA